MNQSIPYRKVIRLALITTILFGLIGITPALEFSKNELEHIRRSFFTVSGITLILWIINTGLLWAGQKYVPFKYIYWFRYLLSAIFSGIIIIVIYTVVLPKVHALMELHRYGSSFPPPPNLRRPHFIFPILQVGCINIIIIVLLEMVLLRDKKTQIENENNLLRMANLEAKHGQLKQQLQPHFLFNSLNVLKALIKRYPEQAEDYLERLSELLRFSVNSNTQTLIPLKQELELVTNYLHMQQVRFGNALTYQINIPSYIESVSRVPVYSLQILAENAIKHNILTTGSPLHIFITAEEQKRTVSVSNNLQPKPSLEESAGVGLANLSERYKLLGNYDIEITRTEDEFTVAIKVLDI